MGEVGIGDVRVRVGGEGGGARAGARSGGVGESTLGLRWGVGVCWKSRRREGQRGREEEKKKRSKSEVSISRKALRLLASLELLPSTRPAFISRRQS
jgi:hypothetical protein